ncbi:uncharacterized protein LOC116345824 [Contarinia nasturtii]|uniref:uncharacterized protein LOC116345824 n=1 Tax=Contarinia nasturtii TaxID=265458 RepID=UPI0012D3BB18|nr:uncharacterized protein LOC116345824 [Contarinia nasturtii]
MPFKLEEVKLSKLKTLWSVEINPKLPDEVASKLNQQLQLVLDSENDTKTTNLFNLIQLCCEYTPVNFEEFIAYVIIVTSINFVSVSSPFVGVEKLRLIAHTFSTHGEFWSRDQHKVVAVAEAIWKVSKNALNINHTIIAINGFNQFTFNVSIVLLLAALGSSTSKSDNLPLLKADTIHKKMLSLKIVNDKNSKQAIFDFLSLFQTYQRFLSTPAAEDESLTTIIHMKREQLQLIEENLKKTIQELNKTIRDHRDLNENPMIVHFIELVMNNMHCMQTQTI